MVADQIQYKTKISLLYNLNTRRTGMKLPVYTCIQKTRARGAGMIAQPTV